MVMASGEEVEVNVVVDLEEEGEAEEEAEEISKEEVEKRTLIFQDQKQNPMHSGLT